MDFKVFFRKAWGYIAAFVGGIVSVLCLNRKRESRAQRDIDELRGKLQEYSELVRETGRANTDLAKELDRHRDSYRILESKLADCGEAAIDIDAINREIGDECDQLGSAIEQLRRFIDQNGKTGGHV